MNPAENMIVAAIRMRAMVENYRTNGVVAHIAAPDPPKPLLADEPAPIAPDNQVRRI